MTTRPLPTRLRRLGAKIAVGVAAVTVATVGGVALAGVIDSALLGSGLTIQGVTGLTVTEHGSSGSSNAAKYIVAYHEDHDITSAWTAKVTGADDSETADFQAFFDCELRNFYKSPHVDNAAYDCETAQSVALTSGGSTVEPTESHITFTRTAKTVVGNRTVSVQPQLVVDDGS